MFRQTGTIETFQWKVNPFFPTVGIVSSHHFLFFWATAGIVSFHRLNMSLTPNFLGMHHNFHAFLFVTKFCSAKYSFNPFFFFLFKSLQRFWSCTSQVSFCPFSQMLVPLPLTLLSCEPHYISHQKLKRQYYV